MACLEQAFGLLATGCQPYLAALCRTGRLTALCAVALRAVLAVRFIPFGLLVLTFRVLLAKPAGGSAKRSPNRDAKTAIFLTIAS